jgi:GTP-binding protein
MFVDKAQVELKAGKGGDGIVSFRHEIYVDKGGPDGGDGGRGGDIILKASRNENTLSKFRFKKSLVAEDGKNGSSQNKRGRKGNNLTIKVPVGTVVLAEDGLPIVDLAIDNQEFIIARGGDGGFGNAHFTSSVRQAPKIAEKGEPGDELIATLELKIIADVGLIGLPNAGKSTFLSVVSNARPEIANYPFTTLKPNLGVVELGDDSSMLIADIPGLIEGASQGKGLGDEFLRHVSRCQVLLHLIDSTSDNVAKDYQIIRSELKNYSLELAHKPEVVALTKVDLIDAEIAEFQKEQLRAINNSLEIFTISAQAHIQIKELLAETYKLAMKPKKAKEKASSKGQLPVISLKEKPDSWKLVKKTTYWVVTGRKIEKFAKRTDYDNEYGVTRLRDIMKKMGILRELDKKQAQPGQKIVIGQPKIGEIIY